MAAMSAVRYWCVLFSVVLAAFSLSIDAAQAKKKKDKNPNSKYPQGVIVQADEVFSITVQVASGKKKNKSYTVYCKDDAGGMVANRGGNLIFSTFPKLIKFYKKKGSKGRPKVELYNKLKKASGPGCKKPDFLSLERYTGPFGPEQARILWDRFAFGGSPQDIAQSVQAGLDGTINRLMTVISEPQLDIDEAELRCDGLLADHENNRNCDPEDFNDVYFPGVRYALVHRFRHTANPYFHKLWMFLHDERITASSSAVGGCDAHALIPYVEYLKRAAFSGDYAQAIMDATNDHVFHLAYLDGDSNWGGLGNTPNENMAREILELVTIGPLNLDGQPNYGDYDIAQVALALTGHTIESYYLNEQWVCLSGFSEGLHAQGPKVVFSGTPQQSIVYNKFDLVNALKQHPRLAEHLAEDIWKEFIGPFHTPSAIRELAAIIRNAGYNLHTAMGRVMASRAVFAARNRKALIKHPVDALIGFLRTTQLPFDYWDMDHQLEHLSQRPLRPSTVFGWNEKALAGEQYVLEWRNVILEMMTTGDWYFEEEDFDLHARFVAPVQNDPHPSRALIDRIAGELNVTLTQAQRDHLDVYMNFERRECWGPGDDHPDCVAGNTHKLDREAFDPHPDGEWNYKLRGLISIIAQLPEYRMK